MSARIDHQLGYILHTRPYRETSLIVEAFTRAHGRVSLVARGARRAQSSIKSRLLAFQPLELSWFGKSSLRTLHDAEWLGGTLRLQGAALMCGFYLNELLLRLLHPEDPHETLHDHYVAALAALSDGREAEPVLRRFELDLLTELGYAQPLGHLADGGELRPDGRYAYAFDEGVIPWQDGQPGYRGKTLLDLASGDFSDPRSLQEGKQLMRALINHYLDDKPLMTRQLLLELASL